MENIVILGSTGSIGIQTLDVLSRMPAAYRVFALVAHHNLEVLLAQYHQFYPHYLVLTDPTASAVLRMRILEERIAVTVLSVEDLPFLLQHPEVSKIMFAMAGIAALSWMFMAARASKDLLIANKEAFLLGGPWLVKEVLASGARLFPVDSEHSALFQLFSGLVPHSELSRVFLTASGGPFLRLSQQELALVSPEQACAHPTWRMGRKISVDSATLMNKGFELLEAALMFHLPATVLDAIIHPQSIVHALVEYTDGSTVMHMSYPDMRLPIAYALTYPDKPIEIVSPVSKQQMSALTFEALNLHQFPCFSIAREIAHLSHDFVIILNAANDYAVTRFLSGHLAFLDIATWIQRVLDHYPISSPVTTEEDIVLLNEDVYTFMSTMDG